MKEYKRTYPRFALCGLNCGLCPRYHTEGSSRCPGCGGEDFHIKHPACAVITCSKKNGNVEFCFECAAFPCERYKTPSEKDSFITYKNRLDDFEKARRLGVAAYVEELDQKVEMLEFLFENCNDGKRKNYYCVAVNLLSLDDVGEIVTRVKADILPLGLSEKERSVQTVALFEERAEERGVVLALRK